MTGPIINRLLAYLPGRERGTNGNYVVPVLALISEVMMIMCGLLATKRAK
jgi:hypothetical protein